MAKDRPGAGTFTLQEQVKTITNEVIEKVLGSHILFDAERVEDWSDQVGANAVAALVTQCGGETKGRTYHFAVTTTIVQRKGAGLSTSSAAAWNEATDFNVTVLWENQALTCVVVVFALAV